MKHPYTTNLMVKRSQSDELIKGGLLLGGITLSILLVLLYSLDISMGGLSDPLIACSQNIEGLRCKLI